MGFIVENWYSYNQGHNKFPFIDLGESSPAPPTQFQIFWHITGWDYRIFTLARSAILDIQFQLFSSIIRQ